ncbi:hypothetical protein TrLO_g15570 [Triparma laevis f. longispina]|uniref:WW domain-containing protein n=1 Tax=Triparma laevis f. longispina TaxID=1714387 RepID=A0A9W7ANB3_9STRA|nr:hypothetical protein TrLO_g15570 [Triparma laevis f. longispina]
MHHASCLRSGRLLLLLLALLSITLCTASDCDAGYAAPSGSPCTICPFGKYAPPSSTSCSYCEVGKYNPDPGQQSCILCGQGTYLLFTGAVDVTQCSHCALGKYNDNPGLGTYCYDCQRGKIAPFAGAAVCEDCSSGTYASSEGSTECTQCEEGKHAGSSGAEVCVWCAAGTFTNYRGAVVCTFCSGGKYSDSGATSCSSCGQGKFSNPGASSCEVCEHAQGFIAQGEGNNDCEYCGIGKYANISTHECKSCVQGKYSIGSVNECLDCEPGKFNSNDAASSCSPCEPGSAPNGAEGCVQCSKNMYAPFGASECSPCQQGAHSQPGSAYCDRCLSGKYYDELNNDCELCPAGTFTATGGSGIWQCQICSVGFIAWTAGSPNCWACDPGKHTNEQQTDCESCSVGKYSGTAASQCSSCESGKYATAGSPNCFACEAGKYTNGDKDACINCPEGKISGTASSMCTVCETGKYAEGVGNVACNFCNDYEAVLGSTTYGNGTKSVSGCVCPAGEYDMYDMCARLPEGVKSYIVGFTVENLDIEEGYWRSSRSSSVILPCLVETGEHCVGGNDPEDQCAEGYTGPLCAVCQDGYASTGSGMFLKCSTCEGGDVTITIAVGFGLFFSTIFFLAGLTCCCRKVRRSEEGEDGDNDNDRMTLSNNDSLASKRGQTRKELSKIDSKKKFSKVDSLIEAYDECRPYGKIVLSYLQIAGGLSFNFDIGFPPLFTQFMGIMASVVNVEFLSMMPLGCVMNSDSHHTLLMYTLTPFFAGVGMLIAYKVLKLKGKVEASNAVFGWFLFMTFFILPSVSMKIFSTFACREFDGGYGSFMRVDYSIDCLSDEHKMYEMYAGVCVLIFVVGIPAFYVWLLYRSRHLLDPGQKRLEAQYGEKEALRMVLEERERLEEEHPELKSLSFLYDSYEPRYYYFEVLDALRKQMLSGGLVVLGQGSLSQIVVSIFICLCSTRIFVSCKPYIKRKVDIFLELSLWQIFFVMFAALLIRVSEIGDQFQIENESVFDFLLILTQALAPAVMLAMALIKGKSIAKKVSAKVEERSFKNGGRDGEGGGKGKKKKVGEVQLTTFRSGRAIVAGEGVLGGDGKRRDQPEEQPVEKKPVEKIAVPPPPPNPWTKHFDEKEQAFYYLHEDSSTSTWEKPEGFI